MAKRQRTTCDQTKPHTLFVANDEDSNFYCMYAPSDSKSAISVLKMFKDLRAADSDAITHMLDQANVYNLVHEYVTKRGRGARNTVKTSIGEFTIGKLVPKNELGDWIVCKHTEVPQSVLFTIYMVFGWC